MIDRLDLARLWQSILGSDPNQLFGSNAEILIQRTDTGDDLPQPGFVGPSYRPGGVLFLGNNPGNAKDLKDLGDLERRHIRALRDLKAATTDSLQGSFEALMESLAPVMSEEWGLIKQYVRPILSGADIDWTPFSVPVPMRVWLRILAPLTVISKRASDPRAFPAPQTP